MKYYTAFIFNDAGNPHCTHKYLGGQSDEELEKIRSIVDDFFLWHREFPKADFTQREMFGPARNIPVLVPAPGTSATRDFFPELRAQLNRFRPDDFDAFRPHVSTAEKEICRPIIGYALMSGKSVLKVWRNK